MNDWIPSIIFFTMFSISVVSRIFASKNLLEKYSHQRSNFLFNTKGSWSLNSNVFNKKGKLFYIISNGMGFLWAMYIILVMIYNIALNN